jgi:hypothetical protein
LEYRHNQRLWKEDLGVVFTTYTTKHHSQFLSLLTFLILNAVARGAQKENGLKKLYHIFFGVISSIDDYDLLCEPILLKNVFFTQQ